MAKYDIIAGVFDMEKDKELNLPPERAKKMKLGKNFIDISLIPNTKEVER